MIEMLGVLAIVGVLSVGGLAGYAKAMRTIQANEIAQYIEKLEMEYKTQSVTGALTQIAYKKSCADFIGEPHPAGIDPNVKNDSYHGCNVEPANEWGTNRIYMILTSSKLYLELIDKFGYACSAEKRAQLQEGKRPYLQSYQLPNGKWITTCY